MNNDKKHIMDNFKVTNTIPDLTDEEREAVKKEILGKLYKLFTDEEVCIDTRVKQ